MYIHIYIHAYIYIYIYRHGIPSAEIDIRVHHRTTFAQPILIFGRSMSVVSWVFHRRGTHRPASDVTKKTAADGVRKGEEYKAHGPQEPGLFIQDSHMIIYDLWVRDEIGRLLRTYLT